MKFLNRWWLPLLIISLPFERIPSWSVALHGHSATLHISLLVAVVGIIAYGIDTLRHTRWSPRQPEFWLAVYLFIALLSVGVSIDKGRSLIALIATAIAIGAALVVARVMQRYRLSTVLKSIMCAAAVTALFGLYQFIGDSAGLSTHLTGLRTIYTKKVFGFPRVQSTSLEPLYFANYLIAPLLLTAGLAFGRQLRAKVYMPLLVLYALLLALTLSRGGIIGTTVGLVVLTVAVWGQSTWKSRGQTVVSLLLGAALAVGMIYSVTALTNKKPQSGSRAVSSYIHQSTQVTSSPQSADSDRVVDRRLALRAFKVRPVLGQGIGSFGAYAKRVDPAYYPAAGGFPIVNNEYLEILAETGVVGLLALAGFVITLVVRVVVALRQPLTTPTRLWIWSLAAAGIAISVQYYAFSTLYIMSIWVMLGLLMGLTALQPRKSPR